MPSVQDTHAPHAGKKTDMWSNTVWSCATFNDAQGLVIDQMGSLIGVSGFFGGLSLLSLTTPSEGMIYTSSNYTDKGHVYAFAVLQLWTAVLALFCHFFVVIAGVDFNSVVRTCTTKEELAALLLQRIHPFTIRIIMQVFIVGAVLNFIQVGSVLTIQYSYVEGVIYFSLFILFVLLLCYNHFAGALATRRRICSNRAAKAQPS